jgi:hypothetical protein
LLLEPDLKERKFAGTVSVRADILRDCEVIMLNVPYAILNVPYTMLNVP